MPLKSFFPSVIRYHDIKKEDYMLRILNTVKNSVTFQKSSKSLFFEKMVIKYPKMNDTHQNLGISVSMYLKHDKYFFSEKIVAQFEVTKKN